VSESWGGGGGWGNPVVGGTALRIPAIQSPNFSLANGTGWAIFANGTAVFFGLTITDGVITGPDYTINSDGAFFYSGTPALGNLLVSIASSGGTDGEGNVYRDGFSVYDGKAVVQLHINSTVGAPALDMTTGVTSEAEHPSLYSFASNVGLANEYVTTWLIGPGSSFDNKQAAIALVSSAANGADEASGQLIYFEPTETQIAFWDALGIHVNGSLYVTPISAPAAPGSGAALFADAGGNAQVVNSSDSNVYVLGRQVTRVTSTITINSTSPIVIVGATVSAQAYKVRMHIVYLGGGTAANSILSWDGSATVSNALGTLRHVRNSSNADTFVVAINQNSSFGPETFPFNAGELMTYEFEGIVTFSVGGTFNVRGAEGTSGDTWAVAINSYMELTPLG
jgi:hypothetical protein